MGIRTIHLGLCALLAVVSGCDRADPEARLVSASSLSLADGMCEIPEVAVAATSGSATTLATNISVTYEVIAGEARSGVVFDARFALRDAEGNVLGAEDVSFDFDAAMPQHDHGMNSKPVIEVSADGGSWLVRDVLLHMPGTWAWYADVTRGVRTERATFVVDVP
ncbi:MAG: hypothetical protein AAGD00_03230 [Planctomycetota bacterium]